MLLYECKHTFQVPWNYDFGAFIDFGVSSDDVQLEVRNPGWVHFRQIPCLNPVMSVILGYKGYDPGF